MKTFLVGGAVRDTLLNLPVKERDWVVIGETPESMINQGFRYVGKDFPVFLHPQTNEEYALARTERKIAKGYRGFHIFASPDVTLAQDLLRRDLTINAMAMTDSGDIIDPYGGTDDLKNRVFRHVSPAFTEDPVRVLRLARFAARYKTLGFSIAPSTHMLLKDMVDAGELDALVPERIWIETTKALSEPYPTEFFEVLRQCGALAKIFPEIDRLFGIPQPEKYHPEIDCGVHSLMALAQATKLTNRVEIRFAALVHDLGKAQSPIETLPHHHGHEQRGVMILESMCKRLPIPNSFKSLALNVTAYHTLCHKIFELNAATFIDLLQTLGAFRSKHLLQDFVLACEADSRGRKHFEETTYHSGRRFLELANIAIQIDTSTANHTGLKGKQIGDAIRQLRIKAVNAQMHSATTQL